MTHSRRIPIKMIGVWDTVGALGIPWTQAPWIGAGHFYFHNTNLSKLFAHAYHAIAIDEHRAPYRPTLWTRFTPAEPAGPSAPPVAAGSPPVVEQRWFVGAHCNVGGGYSNDDLAQIPLQWIQEKAIACGLCFRSQMVLNGDEINCAPVDSYAEFLRGAYRVIKLGRRFYREIGAPARAVTGGASQPVNEAIDKSVFTRYQRIPSYRPPNLEQWAARRGLDLASVAGDQAA